MVFISHGLPIVYQRFRMRTGRCHIQLSISVSTFASFIECQARINVDYDHRYSQTLEDACLLLYLFGFFSSGAAVATLKSEMGIQKYKMFETVQPLNIFCFFSNLSESSRSLHPQLIMPFEK